MKLSISNIAWPIESNREVYELMKEYGFTGLEVAPGKVIKELYIKDNNEKKALIDDLKEFNVTPIAMQSVLFGTQGMSLFENESSREKLCIFLKQAIDWADFVGIEAIIFGSPKNRIMADSSNKSLWEIAKKFFKEIGDYSNGNGVRFCLEPNPKEYGTNFLNTTVETIKFVKDVDSRGLFVNLDTGALIMNKENVKIILNIENIKLIGHVHISEANLEPIGSYSEHKVVKKTLVQLGYKNWFSIEMRQPNNYNSKDLEIILSKIQALYK